MAKEYVTTFQAAELLSVTPDSVLKWIKSGKLEAHRTPGGHHRIAKKSIQALLKNKEKIASHETIYPQRDFQYYWEFNIQHNNCPDRCEDCLVYKTRALRCYEMCDFPGEFGHLRRFCKSSCDDCEYYKLVNASI
jgi:excisionase family DNA binding protein